MRQFLTSETRCKYHQPCIDNGMHAWYACRTIERKCKYLLWSRSHQVNTGLGKTCPSWLCLASVVIPNTYKIIRGWIAYNHQINKPCNQLKFEHVCSSYCVTTKDNGKDHREYSELNLQQMQWSHKKSWNLFAKQYNKLTVKLVWTVSNFQCISKYMLPLRYSIFLKSLSISLCCCRVAGMLLKMTYWSTWKKENVSIKLIRRYQEEHIFYV